MADQSTTAKPVSEEREREIREVFEHPKASRRGVLTSGCPTPDGGGVVITSFDHDDLRALLATIDELRAKRDQLQSNLDTVTGERDGLDRAARDFAARVERVRRGPLAALSDDDQPNPLRKPKPEQPLTEEREREIDLTRDIASAINRHNAEAGSNTPDFVLADFLTGCLAAFDRAVQERARLKKGGPFEYSADDDLQARIDAAVAKEPEQPTPMEWTRSKPLPPEPTICDSTTGEPLPKIGAEQPPAEPFVDIVLAPDPDTEPQEVFVEIEDSNGAVIRLGEHVFDDGYHRIRIPDPRQVAELRAKLAEAEEERDEIRSARDYNIRALRSARESWGQERERLQALLGGGPHLPAIDVEARIKALREAEKERDEWRDEMRAAFAALRSKIADIAKGGA